jgi:hypothetical protein
MNNEHDEGNEQGDPSDLGNDPDVPIVHVPPPEHPHLPTIEAQHRHHYIKRSVEFIREHWPSLDHWSAFGSFATAVATVVMVIVYIQIKGIMNSQGGQTDKLIAAAHTQACAAQKIADASQRNADAAEKFSKSADEIKAEAQLAVADLKSMTESAAKSIRATQDAAQKTFEQSELDRRPWVGVQTIECNDCTFKDTVLHVGQLNVLAVNTGRTPALDMQVRWTFSIRKKSEPIPTYEEIERRKAESEKHMIERAPSDMVADIRKELAETEPPKEVLAPNAGRPIQIIAGTDVDRGRRMGIPFDPIYVYGFGKLTYYDTARTIQHTTTFCVVSPVGNLFEHCKTGNDMN